MSVPTLALSQPFASLSGSVLSAASQAFRPSLAMLSRPVSTVFDRVAEHASTLPPSAWIPSSFWGYLPPGRDFYVDTGDTGLPGIPNTGTVVESTASAAPQFLNSAWTYAQGFAMGNVPAIVGTALLGAGLIAGNKLATYFHNRYQKNDLHTANQKSLSEATFKTGRIFGISAALVTAGHVWGIGSTAAGPYLGAAMIAGTWYLCSEVAKQYGNKLRADVIPAKVGGKESLTESIKDEIDKYRPNGLFTNEKVELYQSAISIGRVVTGGLAGLAIAQMLGVDLGEFGTAAGFIAGAFTLAIRDIISNWFGWMTLVVNQKFEVGDMIDFDGKHGEVLTIGRMGFSDIQVAGVDTNFNEVTHHIPASKVINQTVTHVQLNKWLKETLSNVRAGDYVTVGDDTGTVASLTDHVLRLNTYDAGGRLKIKRFLVSNLNDNIEHFGSTPPPLVFKIHDGQNAREITIGIGDTIEVGDVKGVVKGYGIDTVMLEIDAETPDGTEKTGVQKIPYYLPRTSLTGVKLLEKAPATAVTETVATEADPAAAA